MIRFCGVQRLERGTHTVLGWKWFRNGSWSSTYRDGTRLFYIYAGPVIWNYYAEFLVDFRQRREVKTA